MLAGGAWLRPSVHDLDCHSQVLGQSHACASPAQAFVAAVAGQACLV